jgi:hypothetical protein
LIRQKILDNAVNEVLEELFVLVVIPCSEKAEMKPLDMCPGCSNHTYNNNMINRRHAR